MTRTFNNNNRRAVNLSKTWSCFGGILFCFPRSHSEAKTQEPVIRALHFGPVFHALLYIKGTNYSRGHCRLEEESMHIFPYERSAIKPKQETP